MKSILLYRWGSSIEPTLIKHLNKLIPNVYEYNREIKDYHSDSEFSLECMQLIEKHNVEAVISFDYFPILSLICSVREIPYISWIYDCPLLTLESLTLSNDCNYIFCFDRLYNERLIMNGAKHCYHLPLAGDPEMINIASQHSYKNFNHKISFVGNFYNDANNRFRSSNWSPFEKGYFEGLIAAQSQIYGFNFVKNVLPTNIVESIIKKCNISISDLYHFDKYQLAANVINKEISAKNRENAINAVSDIYTVDLYTSSMLPTSLKKDTITTHGYVDYNTEMPCVFNQSLINLNISSRTIESGVPQRVFDILASGGFCITNYQPELEDLFANGQELVMYSSIDELVDLCYYYLTHDEERKRISQAGYKTILEQYNYQNSLKYIFEKLYE